MKLADLLPITTVNRLIGSCSGTIEDFDFDYRQFEAPQHGKPSKLPKLAGACNECCLQYEFEYVNTRVRTSTSEYSLPNKTTANWKLYFGLSSRACSRTGLMKMISKSGTNSISANTRLHAYCMSVCVCVWVSASVVLLANFNKNANFC